MTKPASRFVYVTFIRTTPERLWEALTDPEQNRIFWFGSYQDSAFTPGARWTLLSDDGRLTDEGEILEADKPRRLVIRWRNQFRPDLAAEGPSLCVMEIEPVDGAVKLTIDHSIDVPDAKLVAAVSGGWPRILSNLKSWLETGEVVLGGKTAAAAA